MAHPIHKYLFYPFIKNLGKWEQLHGLKPITENNDDDKMFSLRVKNLSLLPEDDILPMFEKSYQDLISNQQLIEVSSTEMECGLVKKMATLETIFGSFVKYFRDFWIKVVTPKRLSVYNLPVRTNNDQERYNRSWKTYVGYRPSPIVFISILTSLPPFIIILLLLLLLFMGL